MDRLDGVERAAALLGVHPDTIRRWWYVQASTERPAAERVSRRVSWGGPEPRPGAVAEVDCFGNPVAVRDISIQVQGRWKEQVQATLEDTVADVVTGARGAGKPVVVERLDFRAKKARLREVSDRQARKLSQSAMPPFLPRWCRGRPGKAWRSSTSTRWTPA